VGNLDAMKLSSIPAGLFVFIIAMATFFALSAIATIVFFIMGQAVPERQPGDPMRRASSCVGSLTCSASATASIGPQVDALPSVWIAPAPQR
jgi:hypothetical protein